jgi:hypothetical protein
MRRKKNSNVRGIFALLIGVSGIAAAAGSACGGSSEVKDAGATDTGSGNDTGVSDTGVVDTGPKDTGCDAPDLLTLMVPDATTEAGINPAKCYGCIQMSCMSLLGMCNMDCACRTTIAQLPECVAMQGGSLQQAVLACTQGLDPQYLIGLAGCAGGCGPACGITGEGGTDAGGGG